MVSLLLPDPPHKMAVPDILLPPEVIWNLSRLSRYLMLSWTSSEEGDHATLSLMFDKTQSSRIRPAAARTKQPMIPLLPDLPTLPSRPSEDINPDLVEMETGRSQTVITISPDKNECPKPRIKTEPASPASGRSTVEREVPAVVKIKKEAFNPDVSQTSEPAIPAKNSRNENQEAAVACVKKALHNATDVDVQQTVSRTSKSRPVSATSTSEQIDSLLRVCRLESDKEVSTRLSKKKDNAPSPSRLPSRFRQRLAVPDSQRPIDKPTTTAEQKLSREKDSVGTPGRKSERAKICTKKGNRRDSFGIKATVFLKDSRKRKVFRKTSQPPRKRRSLDRDVPEGAATDVSTTSRTGDSPQGSASVDNKERRSSSDMEAEPSSATRDSVEEYLTKIKRNINYQTPSRYNNRQCLYTVCDSGPNAFHISCYISRNKLTTVHSDITLKWLEKNSWKIPVYVMQQAGLRVLYRTLSSRRPSDSVSRREKELIASLL